MPALQITLDLNEQPWTDLEADVERYSTKYGATAELERVGILPGGMASGRSCVELAIRLPDGELILAETSLRLWTTTAKAIAVSPLVQHEREV